MSQCIINNYKAGSKDKYQQSWRKAFKDNSKRLEIKVVCDTYRGDIWKEMIAGELKASITDTRNSPFDNSTFSLQYQKILTEKDKPLMKHMYDKIGEKWCLKEGVVVEDVIYNETKGYSVEHPFHSYILHINDSKLVDMFKPEEIEEIEKESGKADLMKALPEPLANMLMNLNGKANSNSLFYLYSGILQANVLPTEATGSNSNQVRPDAIVCEIDQSSWGKSLGFGEVKLADVTPNLNELGQDLLRLATLSKNALLKSGLNASMSFQIHGYRMKIYMSMLIPGTGITAMLEVLSLEFPRSVLQLDAFVTRRNLDSLVHLHEMFWRNCLSKQEAKTAAAPNTLELSTLNAIRQSTRDRTRPNNIHAQHDRVIEYDDQDTAIQSLKSEIRSFKGALLSRRNFPTISTSPVTSNVPSPIVTTATEPPASIPDAYHPRRKRSFRSELPSSAQVEKSED
ncbi:hypothetical protein CU097_009074 [Rhizopus azygosporus]|uniref:Uncharacterized protein n=2 Tax=Rhizopus TaxID=4842 RepID=A0A367JCH7_RHIAZ|nr:hypothetical protein CU097_009074 [Rhizopus azygosporus]